MSGASVNEKEKGWTYVLCGCTTQAKKEEKVGITYEQGKSLI